MPETRVSDHERLNAALIDHAREHADKSNGQLVALAEDTNLPGQDGFIVYGDPQPPAVVDSIAKAAQPRYGELRQKLAEQRREVRQAGEILKGGGNIALIANHSDIKDIAIAQAAFYSLLKNEGYDFRTGIIISKMVAFLSQVLDGEPAHVVTVLKLLENETFLSYPKTESARRRLFGLLPSEIETHNKSMRHEVYSSLGKGALLLAMAPSGTTDKPLSREPNVLEMGRIGHGTYSMLGRPNTWTLPTAIWYGEGEPVFKICGPASAIKTEAEANRSMELIAQTLSDNVPNRKFVYQSS